MKGSRIKTINSKGISTVAIVGIIVIVLLAGGLVWWGVSENTNINSNANIAINLNANKNIEEYFIIESKIEIINPLNDEYITSIIPYGSTLTTDAYINLPNNWILEKNDNFKTIHAPDADNKDLLIYDDRGMGCPQNANVSLFPEGELLKQTYYTRDNSLLRRDWSEATIPIKKISTPHAEGISFTFISKYDSTDMISHFCLYVPVSDYVMSGKYTGFYFYPGSKYSEIFKKIVASFHIITIK